MASDLRDVLNLPDGGPRPAKKSRPSVARPNLKGLAREVQSLGGDHPIVIAPEVTFKKKRFTSKKPASAWELRPFKNSARDDQTLVLRHWRRKFEGDNANATGAAAAAQAGEKSTTNGAEEAEKQQMEDSAFAKYNVRVSVPQYSDDQYMLNLQNVNWTKEETDYLLALAKDYDLRWPLIWDRYEYVAPATNGTSNGTTGDGATGGDNGDGESKAVIPAPRERSLEDLKARYYEVASSMMVAQKPEQYMTDAERSLYNTMASFDPASETARKQYAAASLERTKEEAREEEALLVEVRRIMARNERFNEERRELYRRLDFPRADQDISSFKTSAGLHSLLQNLLAADKSKKRRSLAAGPEGASPAGGAATQGQQAEGAAAGASRRDSIAASTATTAAAGAATGHNRRDSGSVGPSQTPTTTTATGKKASAAAAAAALQEKKKSLSEAEQRLYGVTYHDRLSSGPTFRTERINRLFTQKSGQMQQRITNVLGELEFPSRLTMPTHRVTGMYERLLGGIMSLLDVRKQGDKLDAETKIEMQKKALREAEGGKKGGEKEKEKGTGGDKDKEAGGQAAGAAEGAPVAGKPGEGADKGKEEEKNKAGPQDAPKDAPAGEAEKANARPTQGADAAPDGQAAQKEQDKDRAARPESSGHKRSASVLSTASDKSAKRQKK